MVTSTAKIAGRMYEGLMRARMAQWRQQLICNQSIGGSSPSPSSKFVSEAKMVTRKIVALVTVSSILT